MSEAQRWKVKNTLPNSDGGTPFIRPEVVLAADFDRVTAERDAAKEEIATLKHPMNSAVQVRAERDALQQRLTAADERVDQAVTALNEIARVSRMGEKPFEIATLAIGEMSAIKRAEGGGDDKRKAALPQANVSLANEGEKPAVQTQGEQVAYDPEKENKLFEAWARTQSSVSLQLCDIGLYYQRDTGLAHDAWQYRAKLAEQPAPVAVAYQYRQRPLWRKDDNSGWMPWQDCSQEAHADYTASPDLHDWQYETRTLYVGPNQQ